MPRRPIRATTVFPRGRVPLDLLPRRQHLADEPHSFVLKQGRAPIREGFPVFELPTVVLDLDAEDSPHVRPYDKTRDGPEQDSRWAHDPSIPEAEQIVARMRTMITENEPAMRKRAARPFAAAHISDHEVMNVALFGGSKVSDILGPGPSPSPRPQPLRKCGPELLFALRRTGIPSPILGLDANAVIPWMRHRQQLANAALEDPSRRAAKTPNDADEFREGLEQCQSLYSLSKLYSRVDGPSSGVDIGPGSIDHLHSRLLTVMQSGDERSSPDAVLKFVNNVNIKQMSRRKDPHRSMTLLGLRLASELGVLPAILQYLRISLSRGFIHGSDEATTRTRLLTGRALLAALERGEGTAPGTRQHILSLVTGRVPGLVEPRPSLLGLDAGDLSQGLESFHLRINLLGELGALRLLWRYRQGPDNDVFNTALGRCIQLLSSADDQASGIDLTTETGDLEKDAALDFQTLNDLDAIHIYNTLTREAAVKAQAVASEEALITGVDAEGEGALASDEQTGPGPKDGQP